MLLAVTLLWIAALAAFFVLALAYADDVEKERQKGESDPEQDVSGHSVPPSEFVD